MKMVLEIGSPSEAWRALSKIADEAEDDAYDSAKREFDTLGIKGKRVCIRVLCARKHRSNET